MNIKKINESILKTSFKKNGRILIGEDGDKLYLSPDGYVAFIIDRDDFKLDIEKILNGHSKTNLMKDHMKKLTDSERGRIVDFGDFVDEKNKTTRVAKLKNSETYAFINKTYMSYFDTDATFSIVSPKHQVFVWEHNECVGFILPMRITEEELK